MPPTGTPGLTGIGLRQPHYAEAMARRPALPFVEVHSENFFGDGGAALQLLREVRAVWPVSLHGVGLGLGSAEGVDAWHLERLARLVDAIDPLRVSDHACFARGPGRHANDLLPVGFTEASLAIMAANVQRVQERLRRPIGVENLSAYLGFDDDTLAEPEFLAELAGRTGCWLLLDVNNLVVNALNAGQDPVAAPCAWIDALGAGAPVGEIHLAGYGDPMAVGARRVVVDDHSRRVQPPAWAAYAHALRRLGPRPTLVEWDTDLPSLDVLLAEAAAADRLSVR